MATGQHGDIFCGLVLFLRLSEMPTLRGMASVTTVSWTSLMCWWVHQPIWQTSEQVAPLPHSLFKCRLPCEKPFGELINKQPNTQKTHQLPELKSAAQNHSFLSLKMETKKKKKLLTDPVLPMTVLCLLSSDHPEVTPSLPLSLELTVCKEWAGWVQRYRNEKKL